MMYLLTAAQPRKATHLLYVQKMLKQCCLSYSANYSVRNVCVSRPGQIDLIDVEVLQERDIKD